MNFSRIQIRLFFSVLFIFVSGLFVSKELFRYQAYFTHDGDHHLSRSYDAIEGLNEGHFPLRWAGSLNYYCGVPVYNFFYPLLYYLVYILFQLTNSVYLSLKLISAASFIIGPIFLFLWLFIITKNNFSSLVGGSLYLFVPYRFVLVYVRNSPEYLCYTIFPILLYLLSLFLKTKSFSKIIIYAFLSSITGAMMAISHNFAAMLLLPLVVLYISFTIFLEKIWINPLKIKWIALIFASIIGLASFFIGPAFLEQKEIKISILNTISYDQHFPTLRQLVFSPWGYGYSFPGEQDNMSFSLGYAQWLTVISALFLALLTLVINKRKIYNRDFLWLCFWLSLSLITIFLMLPYSDFIWRRIYFLQEIQFPWRLLGISAFTISVLAAIFIKMITFKPLAFVLGIIFIGIAIIGNRNHLLVQPVNKIEWYEDYEKNHPHRYETTTYGDDVLNIKSVSACRFDESFVSLSSNDSQPEPVPYRETEIKASLREKQDLAYAPQFKISFPYLLKRNNNQGNLLITSPQELMLNLRLNLEYFPNAYLINFNGRRIDNYHNCQGRICLDNALINKGENYLDWKIVQTPIQRFFNYLSLGFILIWGLILLKAKFSR